MDTIVRRVSKLPLTTKFYVAAGLMLAIAATTFGLVATDYLTRHTLLTAAERAAAQASELKPDQSGRFPPSRWRDLLHAWRQNNFVAAKVWTPDGTVQYASDPRLAGRRFPIDDDLRQALEGKLVYEVGTLRKEENKFERQYGELLEIYAPVKVGEKVAAVHELYLSTKPLRREIARLSRLGWIANGLVFGLLFLGLSGLVRSADRRIRAQRVSLQNAFDDLARHYLATVQSFNLALQSRDNYTAQHSERVAALAMKIGKALALAPDQLEALSIGALFHDIGKIGLADDILLKPDKLMPAEFEAVKSHPIIGHEILAPLPSMAPGLAVVRHHHERWDGSGYPDGLKGTAIELTAQVASFADVYDALISARPYRPALRHEAAIQTMRSMIGTHFNPDLADIVLRILDTLPADRAPADRVETPTLSALAVERVYVPSGTSGPG